MVGLLTELNKRPIFLPHEIGFPALTQPGLGEGQKVAG